MSGPAQCEFFLLRYVPDAVKNEFVNVGVVLVQTNAGGSAAAFADVRFTTDWRRVRCLDPDADVEMLQQLESEIRQRLQVGPEQRAELLAQIKDSLSNTIQIAEPKACLAAEPAQELEQLATQYLEQTRRRGNARALIGRSYVLREMRSAFEQAGVWPLMQKNVPVAQYTLANDPLKIDCSYECKMQNAKFKMGEDRAFRMFHALTFDAEASSAKALAFTFPELRAGIQREHHASAELTAIVAEHEEDDASRFAENVLRKSEIKLATRADLAMIAAKAREELGA